MNPVFHRKIGTRCLHQPQILCFLANCLHLACMNVAKQIQKGRDGLLARTRACLWLTIGESRQTGHSRDAIH